MIIRRALAQGVSGLQPISRNLNLTQPKPQLNQNLNLSKAVVVVGVVGVVVVVVAVVVLVGCHSHCLGRRHCLSCHRRCSCCHTNGEVRSPRPQRPQRNPYIYIYI